MDYPNSMKYDHQFVSENLMGPNAMKLLEELIGKVNMPQNGLVLDLVCG